MMVILIYVFMRVYLGNLCICICIMQMNVCGYEDGLILP